MSTTVPSSTPPRHVRRAGSVVLGAAYQKRPEKLLSGVPAIRLEVLPARLGDCLLVECVRPDGSRWRGLIDGGPPGTWKAALEPRLALLGPDDRIDAAVVTHIDSDHIGGMVHLLRSDLADRVDDFWYNAPPLLSIPYPPQPGAERRSVSQGLRVSDLLLEEGGTAVPWNAAFGGRVIDTGAEGGFQVVDLPGGPRITVLSPTTKRLSALAQEWDTWLQQALAPEQPVRDGSGVKQLDPLDDLVELASRPSVNDTSPPNGSSIAFLLEHRGASVLFGADAFGPVLDSALFALSVERDVPAIEVDVFKVPHHGSRANVVPTLVRRLPAQHYIFSSNGDTFRHPDDEAVARVITNAPRGATLWFNYRNARTERWAEERLTAEHGYRTSYPRDGEAGVVIELEARS